MALQFSMVLFNEEPALSTTLITNHLASSGQDLADISEAQGKGNTLSFTVGAVDVVMGVMPAPIPWADLEGPCETSVLWSQAAEQVQAHTHHVIVTVHGEATPIELSILLTQVTAALMAVSSASIGVYWTAASLLVPKALFCDFATEVLPLGPPLPIWVDYRVGWTQVDVSSAGFTTGLSALGLMDVEAPTSPESPADLRDRLESIANYLVEHGMVINDGDTVGNSAAEQIRVVYTDSSFGVEGAVMRLVYEAA